jgi:hypothetical protein
MSMQLWLEATLAIGILGGAAIACEEWKGTGWVSRIFGFIGGALVWSYLGFIIVGACYLLLAAIPLVAWIAAAAPGLLLVKRHARRSTWLVLFVGLAIVGGFFGVKAILAANEAAEQKLAADRAAAEKRLAAERAERARVCVADDLPRLEALAQSIRSDIHENMTLAEAKAVADKLTGQVGEIKVPDDDIKQRVLVYGLSPRCDSPFYLLVNVQADEHGKLRYLNVWAMDTPRGYAAGWRPEFSSNFEQARVPAPSPYDYVWNSNTGRYEIVPPPKRQTAPANQRAVDEAATRHNVDWLCAPDLSKEERLRRLATFGPVRETGLATYEAGGHLVEFFPVDPWPIEKCR